MVMMPLLTVKSTMMLTVTTKALAAVQESNDKQRLSVEIESVGVICSQHR